MAQALRLVSFDLCPYVERSRIVLLEKGLAHDVAFIDLRNKPDWFLRISPMGKVPVLLVDDRPIFESTVINELIEELYPAPRLMPTAPLDRADARAWIVFANDTLMPLGMKAQMALSPASIGPLGVILEPLQAALAKVEAELLRRGGPFFLGREFSLVDAAYAPFLRRLRAAEEWHRSPLLAGTPRLSAYVDTLLARPSIAQADPGDVGPRTRRLLAQRATAAAT
jgi:glutathione S-transferase